MWGQWKGGVTVTFNGQVYYGICTLCIDRDEQYRATLAFAPTGQIPSANNNTAGILLPLSLLTEDAATGRCDWRTNGSFLFDPTFTWRSGVNEVEPLTVVTAPMESPHAGLDARSLTVTSQSGNIVAEGQLYDPGLDHPALRVKAHTTTWKVFREWALAYSREHPGVLFRGHSSSRKRLMTTFHRRGRRSLLRYHFETLPQLASQYQNVSGERVDLTDSHDYSRLITLARHHGYPTPVLDWTFSPFVAAYFAFGDCTLEDKSDDHVRIFCLDPDRVNMAIPPGTIIDPRPCLTAMRLTDRGNQRGVAQQSQYLFCNVANVEALMVTLQQEPARQVPFKNSSRLPQDIEVWDIPRAESREALHDLRLMGITGATLFPGTQGFFDAARERDFDRE